MCVFRHPMSLAYNYKYQHPTFVRRHLSTHNMLTLKTISRTLLAYISYVKY